MERLLTQSVAEYLPCAIHKSQLYTAIFHRTFDSFLCSLKYYAIYRENLELFFLFAKQMFSIWEALSIQTVHLYFNYLILY